MPDDLATVLERASTHATINTADLSTILTMSVNRVYGLAREGSVCGIAPIRVGTRLRWPSKPVLRLIGELEDEPETGADQ